MIVDSSGVAQCKIVDTSDATKKCLGVCVASNSTNRTVLLSGRYRNDTLYGSGGLNLTAAGVLIYRHIDTDGACQKTTPVSPTDTGKIAQFLGIVDNAEATAGYIILVNPGEPFTIN
jgi:hypothetical protein